MQKFRLAFPRRPLISVTMKKATVKRTTLKRIVSLAMVVAVLLSGGLAVAMPASSNASMVNVLTNGSFEHGFTSQPGCGDVGYGWSCLPMVARPAMASTMTSGSRWWPMANTAS